jgi:organic radical activating enzyme
VTGYRQIPAVTGDSVRDGKIHLPHVDLMVGQACELRCVGCTNGIGMLPHLPIFKTDAILADIASAARVMSAGKVCLLGGEALLHRDIVQLIEAARELGDVVQVLTNGIALHRMTAAFWEAVDWLKISIYPGRTPQENIDLAIKMQTRYGFELDYKPVADDPFRAVLTRELRDAEDAQRTFDGCWFKTYTRKIEAGYFWRCCTSPSISQHVLGLPADADGIALDGLTVDALAEFLARRGPTAACFRCHGNTGPVIQPWSEERDRSRWVEVSSQ